jgi:hypothetical protein
MKSKYAASALKHPSESSLKRARFRLSYRRRNSRTVESSHPAKRGNCYLEIDAMRDTLITGAIVGALGLGATTAGTVSRIGWLESTAQSAVRLTSVRLEP